MKQIYSLFLFLSVALMTGCVSDPDLEGGLRNAQKPSVSTTDILSSTATSVTVSGEVLLENGATVTESGFCWSLDSDCAWIETNKQAVSEGKGTFEATIENLTNDKDYYIRAYAINAADTGYGDILSFKTKDGLGTVKTIAPTEVRATSAICGGVITVQGEADVEERGVYLMLQPEPSALDSLILCEMETDSFYCTITGLNPETTYYVRAYAANKFGSYNGANVDTFTTTNGYPTLDSESFKRVSVSYTYAEFSFTVESEGDAPVTACGFCFGEEESPTLANDTIVCGSGVGDFTGRIYKMEQQKAYYVRAYATNAMGTVYSDGVGIYTILESVQPTVTTGTITQIVDGTALVSGEVLSEGVSAVTESGVCWGTTTEPTLEDCTGYLALSSGAQSFSGTITGLRGGTTYYVRAYAINENGTAYGEKVTFQTPDIFSTAAKFSGSSRRPLSTSYCTVGSSTGFLLGGDLSGGDQGSECTDELWAYVATRGQWQSLSSLPVKLCGMGSFSIGFALWAFGGWDESKTVSDSFYFYSTTDNRWEARTDDAGPRPDGKYRPACCVMNSVAYLIGGRRDAAVDSVWTYTPASASYTWEAKASFPIAQYGGIAVTVNDRIYAGFGIIGRDEDPPTLYSRQLWSTDESADSWEEETSLSEEDAYLLCAVAYDDYIYGVDADGYIWCYDTVNRTWTQKSQLDSNYRDIHCMYVLSSDIYIGLGSASTLITYAPAWDN